MKFKAAILTELNKPLTVDYIEVDGVLKFGQVLVQINKSGICGAQLQELSGNKGNGKFLPHLLGHEGSGIVYDIGPGVTKVKKGDKVVMHWRKGTGIESEFPSYIFSNKKMSSGKVTTLSEYSVVSENRLTKVPDNTPDELSALLGCGLTTALGTINNEAQLKFGESVMIVGCGGVGLNLIQGAKLASAYPIVAVDIIKVKEKLCISVGATEYINNSETILSEILGKRNFDVIIDTTGNVKIIEETLKFLSESGRYILVGQPKPSESMTISNPYKLFDGNGKVLKATQGGQTDPDKDIIRYINLYNAKLLDVKKIITHVFDLEDINSAFELLKSGNAGRILINTKQK